MSTAADRPGLPPTSASRGGRCRCPPASPALPGPRRRPAGAALLAWSPTPPASARAWRWAALRVLGLENLPERGPLIIAGNHLSSLDTIVLGGNTPGANYAMAKRELFRPRPIAWMWGGCNVFPVDRHTADRWALRTAIEALERGGG